MHTAICAFDSRARAEEARDGLLRAGFDSNDLHIEHRDASTNDRPANDRWDSLEREVAVDRGVLSSFGHFFTSLLGRDQPSGHVDTYSGHVERGNYVLVVDTASDAEAARARNMLQGLNASDLNVVQRAGRLPLRDLLGRSVDSAAATMAEREREREAEGWTASASTASPLERERAVASHAVSPTHRPDLRDPDLERAPGLRQSDKDKPI